MIYPLPLLSILTLYSKISFQIAQLQNCTLVLELKQLTCILNGALAVDLQKSLVDHMKNEPFSLATDESNDSGL